MAVVGVRFKEHDAIEHTDNSQQQQKKKEKQKQTPP